MDNNEIHKAIMDNMKAHRIGDALEDNGHLEMVSDIIWFTLNALAREEESQIVEPVEPEEVKSIPGQICKTEFIKSPRSDVFMEKLNEKINSIQSENCQVEVQFKQAFDHVGDIQEYCALLIGRGK